MTSQIWGWYLQSRIFSLIFLCNDTFCSSSYHGDWHLFIHSMQRGKPSRITSKRKRCWLSVMAKFFHEYQLKPVNRTCCLAGRFVSNQFHRRDRLLSSTVVFRPTLLTIEKNFVRFRILISQHILGYLLYIVKLWLEKRAQFSVLSASGRKNVSFIFWNKLMRKHTLFIYI